jgi:hypothetical protein
MMELVHIPLSTQQVQAIRKWLSLPEASLCRQVLEANAMVIVKEATDLMLDGALNRDQSSNAGKEKMDEALPFIHADTQLGRMLKNDDMMFLVRPQLQIQ